ncbi:MAG: type II toxin-antitoxin system VapC family toxin [Candidatus Sumerlaeota bacterium]|nr:type II toxin-antitoxin system VapC family toxin [Candidatus Sumerlaeota bacterium]
MFLDSGFCIDLMREEARNAPGAAIAKLRSIPGVPLYVPVFVLCELHAGARLSAHPLRELRKVERFAQRVRVVYPDSAFPVAYGEAESLTRRQGAPIPVMDLLIGVLAKLHGLPLLTRDTTHFRRIPGLVVETY